ncbi:MAG: NUDIX domain-containing protein [Flavobacteriales bacterium]|nr:NUDIX domain-containing protein [Flavobacteriales bacterium]MCB9448833.1 NUDIX domain-containing protein [Flavobacteriales bacterium]
MYKVFVNKVPLLLTDGHFQVDPEGSHFVLQYGDETSLLALQTMLEGGMLAVDQVVVYGDSADEILEHFKQLFVVEVAAGGWVTDPSGQLLAIQRPQHGEGWDLPKGKAEKGETLPETAEREIREECGAGELTNTGTLPVTYHTFFRKDQRTLKECHWYRFESPAFDPIPQEGEGISVAAWIGVDEFVANMAFPALGELVAQVASRVN